MSSFSLYYKPPVYILQIILALAALGVSIIKIFLFKVLVALIRRANTITLGIVSLPSSLATASSHSYSPIPSTTPNTTKPANPPEGEISNYYHQSGIDRISEVLEEMGDFKGEHDSQLSRNGLLSYGYFHYNPGELEVLRWDELCFELGYLCVGWDTQVCYTLHPC
jgi:hypothetical protein